tara:strand:+ start:63 stop:266 length:204 start_codon:yes stop_codon:yes gene_type:complete
VIGRMWYTDTSEGHQAYVEYALADNPRLAHVTYKVKVSDIKLIGKFDRKESSRIKNEIVQDIKENEA